MALHNQLPIYRTVRELTQLAITATRNMPRDYKRTLGERLKVCLNPSKTILQPVARGIDFVGQVIKPWRRTLRRRTFTDLMARTAVVDASELYRTANSYFGLLRQVTHSHHDRALLANLVRRRGLAVNHRFTKSYRRRA